MKSNYNNKLNNKQLINKDLDPDLTDEKIINNNSSISPNLLRDSDISNINLLYYNIKN